MNSFDAAVSRILVKRLGEEIQRLTELLVSGSAGDYIEYRENVARVAAFKQVLEYLGDAEHELKS